VLRRGPQSNRPRQVGVELSTLRALRILRILKSLRFFSGIKTILGVIGSAMVQAANVLAFMAFLYVVSGILGLQMFRGHMRARCEYAGFELTAELDADKYPLVNSHMLNKSDLATLVNGAHAGAKPVVPVRRGTLQGPYTLQAPHLDRNPPRNSELARALS
jgi:hypothetical protein